MPRKYRPRQSFIPEEDEPCDGEVEDAATIMGSLSERPLVFNRKKSKTSVTRASFELQQAVVATGRNRHAHISNSPTDDQRFRDDNAMQLSNSESELGERKTSLRRRSSESAFYIGASATINTLRWKSRLPRPKDPPIVRFRRVAKLAMICLRLCKQSYESVGAAKNEFLSVVQVSKDMEATINKDGLYFDPNDFKANKERRLGLEARRLLQLKPDSRTEKDIEYLQIALRRIRAFAEYPKRMQRILVQVGWYEGYEPERAIVRQGHVPQSFYFIISGTVVVTAYDKNAQASRTLVFLYQGMSFGELAVITRSVRQATVSSTTDTELLCISSQDFENVFMSGGTKNVNDPDHNSFMNGIRFLKHIPVRNLLQNTNACLFHYFDRGQVMVRDSNKSDWIYIVKSGSLSVLKKLLEAVPELEKEDNAIDKAIDACSAANTPYLDLHANSTLYERYGQPEYYARRRKLKERRWDGDGPREKIYQSVLDMERRLAQTLPGLFNYSDRLGVIDYDHIINNHRSHIRPRESADFDPLPPIDSPSGSHHSDKNKPTGLKKTKKGVYLSRGPSYETQRHATSKKRRQNKDMETLAKRRRDQAKEQQKNLAGRKTIADEFDNKPLPDTEPTAADLHPMFILVQILERGQYFGISQMIYTDQPSLSVVSNGAECILISKKFFIENSKAYAMHYLRLTECPFPSDGELQGSLQDYVNWQAHRSRIYQRLVTRYEQRAYKKNQFLPRNNFGQYCYRTGPL